MKITQQVFFLAESGYVAEKLEPEGPSPPPPFQILADQLTLDIGSVVGFQRWWVLKGKIFAQESTWSKEIVLKQSCDELWFVKKCQNCTFKVNFLCQKSTEFFQKKISFKTTIYETIFF